MRKVQVNISIEIFNDAAEKQFDGHEPISVYADANNVYEALCAAFDETMAVLKENGRHIGRAKEHTSTAELKERKQRINALKMRQLVDAKCKLTKNSQDE